MRDVLFWLAVTGLLLGDDSFLAGCNLTDTVTHSSLSLSPGVSRAPSHQDPAVGPALPIINIANDRALSHLNISYDTFRPLKHSQYAHHIFHRNRRDNPQQSEHCGPGKPCADRSCCNQSGDCGFGSAHCGTTCVSNCQAKAMCGVDAPQDRQHCAMNLCCSSSGWCGVSHLPILYLLLLGAFA